jgi:hypothetical protein
MLKNIKPVEGDRFLCDTCSLKSGCRYFRVGSVCSVPDAEVAELANLFGTRDSDQIIDALGKLLEIQSGRFAKGIDSEDEATMLDPEVTKLGTTLFDQGVKLAKLIDPTLAANGKMTNNILAIDGSISGKSARELMAHIAKELEERGVARGDITPEMIKKILELPPKDQAKAISAVAAGG